MYKSILLSTLPTHLILPLFYRSSFYNSHYIIIILVNLHHSLSKHNPHYFYTPNSIIYYYTFSIIYRNYSILYKRKYEKIHT